MKRQKGFTGLENDLVKDLLSAEDRAKRYAEQLEAVALLPRQHWQVRNWLDMADGNERADSAIVKITDALGRPIVSLTAEWLRALPCRSYPMQQPKFCEDCGATYPCAKHPDPFYVPGVPSGVTP